MTITIPGGKTAASVNTSTHWPKAGASFILIRGDTVLLVERAKPPRVGLWSLPGGHIEPGETSVEAAIRELLEETGLEATAEGLADIQDVIITDPVGRLQAHFLMAVFYGRWQGGEPVAATDAGDARFIAFDALDEYPLTPGAKRLIALARAKLGE